MLPRLNRACMPSHSSNEGTSMTQQPAARRPPATDPPAPGPARLSAAVDVIVGHLRRLVLLQAWAKWQPKLTQVKRASRCVYVSPPLLRLRLVSLK